MTKARAITVVMILLWGPRDLSAKPLCTLDRVLFAPGKYPHCLSALATRAKSAEDRKWLHQTAAHWTAPPDLTLQLLAGGFKLVRRDQTIGSVQFLAHSPPVALIDGRIRVGRGGRSMTGSIHSLFERPRAARSTSRWLREAHAAEVASDTLENVTKLFRLTLPFEAKDFVESGADAKLAVRLYPHVSWLRRMTVGRGLRCGPHGIESVSLEAADLGVKSRVVVRSLAVDKKVARAGEEAFVIEGLAPRERLRAELRPSSRGYPCLDSYSTELDQKYCDRAWTDLLKIDPDIRKRLIVAPVLSCGQLESGDRQQRCLDFWDRWRKKFASYSVLDEATYSVCQDETCGRMQALDAFDVQELVRNSLSGVEAQKLIRELNYKLFGLALLGECCKEKACREMAYSKIAIDLEPSAPAAGASH